MKNFMIVHKSLYRLFLKLSIVIVNGRLNKNASGKTEKKKNCIKQFSLWACRCLNSLYSVCTGKVNTCIQWSKHFITPLFFYILGKLYRFFTWKYVTKLGTATLRQSEPDNHCQETCSTKENVEVMVETDSLTYATLPPHTPPPPSVPMPCIPERIVK